MPKFLPNDKAVCAVPNIYTDGVHAGLKKDNALDVAFIYSDIVCEVSAVYTTNKMLAAPLRHAKNKGAIKSNFILINSKNANAMTGTQGIKDIDEILDAVNTHFDNRLVSPLMSSTGVIGVFLPKEKIINAAKTFNLTQKAARNASKAIMTTDAFEKTVAYDVIDDEGKRFSIGAMAKGAGMINPAMATMLCFITTDINLPHQEVQAILEEVNEQTFNAVSVDGDTSTNDTVFVFNTRQSQSSSALAFKEALFMVMHDLALKLVQDGEGATKVVTYSVTGAHDDAQAQKVAKILSNSLLIKTALFGEDPNWGRIAMSVGASGVVCSEDSLSIAYDDVKLLENGVNLFDEDVEAHANRVMKQKAFTVHVNLGVGSGAFKAYGCDLGHEYVKINADYRT